MNGNGNLMPFKAQPFKIPNARPKNPEQNKEKSGAEDNLQKFHEQTLKRYRDMMEMQLRTLKKIKENAPEQQRKQLDDLFKRQSDLMNQQLRELERNLKPEKKSEPDSKPQPPAEAETPATQESREKKLCNGTLNPTRKRTGENRGLRTLWRVDFANIIRCSEEIPSKNPCSSRDTRRRPILRDTELLGHSGKQSSDFHNA